MTDLPKTVFAQISRTCNLRCRMCGHEAWQRPTGFMGDDVFMRIIEEMKANNITRLALTAAQGEPLLAPKAPWFIREALAAGLDVHVNTNCTPLRGRSIAALALAASTGRLTIQCSFSGYDKESYEKIYIGADFDKTVLKLRALHQTMVQQQCAHAMTVRGVVYSADDAIRTRVFLNALGIDGESIHLEIPDNFAGHVENCRDLSGKTLHTCPWLTDYVVVYDDGTVSACACRDSEGVMALGNIMTMGLAEMRVGATYRNTVAAFEAKDISHLPLCGKCDVPYF